MRRSLIEQMCFSSFLNCSQSSTARSAAGKQFQTRGPATANDLSPRLVLLVIEMVNVDTIAAYS